MPRGDGTGPKGQGPMTGRGAGFCAGFNSPGFMNSTPRLGMGFRRGARRGGGSGIRRNQRIRATQENTSTSVTRRQPAGENPRLQRLEEKVQTLAEELKRINEKIK